MAADRQAGSPSSRHAAPSTHVILCGLGNVGRQIALRVHGRDLVLGRIDVDGRKPWEGLTVGDLRGRCGAVVLVGADGATTLSPNPEQPLRAGDALYLICDVAEFGRMAPPPVDAARETSLGARAC